MTLFFWFSKKPQIRYIWKMKYAKTKKETPSQNPFLTDQADALWEVLDKGGTPVTKQEILEKMKSMKSKR